MRWGVWWCVDVRNVCIEWKRWFVPWAKASVWETRKRDHWCCGPCRWRLCVPLVNIWILCMINDETSKVWYGWAIWNQLHKRYTVCINGYTSFGIHSGPNSAVCQCALWKLKTCRSYYYTYTQYILHKSYVVIVRHYAL